MSSIYWIISGRVRASEQACKALTRSNDNGKKQDGKFLRFNRPEKKSLPHYHMWLNISFGKFCHLFLWQDPSPEQWLTMWLNFYFGKCCVILSLVLVTGPVTRTVTHNVAELLFWEMLCHFVTCSCDGTSHQNSDSQCGWTSILGNAVSFCHSFLWRVWSPEQWQCGWTSLFGNAVSFCHLHLWSLQQSQCSSTFPSCVTQLFLLHNLLLACHSSVIIVNQNINKICMSLINI
jgi:hypothetical protein